MVVVRFTAPDRSVTRRVGESGATSDADVSWAR